jgi:hypothetical protein
MTDKKSNNLNDFFKKQSTKKSTKKKDNKNEDEADLELDGETVHKEETKVNSKSKKQATEYESSDEEKTDLTFEDDQTTIKDRKQVEAEKRRLQEESEGVGQGWRVFDGQTKAAQEARISSSIAVKPEGGKGEMKFGGKPVF